MYCPTSNAKADEYFNLGVRALDNGILRRASDYFSMAIGEDSLFCDAWDNLAVIMKKSGGIEKAKSFYFKSMNINKNDFVAYINFGDICLETGNYKMAYDLFLMATFVDSTSPEGFYGLAMYYQPTKNYTQGLTAINVALELYNSENLTVGHEVHFTEGLLYYGAGEIDKAKKILESEYGSFPNHPHMNYYLGLCYLNAENPNKELAQEYIKRAQKEGFKVDNEVLDKLDNGR